MAELPREFTDYTRRLMGEERFERYMQSFSEDAPVSIRLNPHKASDMTAVDGERVPWCRNGYYLKRRPNFTFDPLLHAGCYYVQEAASMFLDEIICQLVTPVQFPASSAGTEREDAFAGQCLDLCAAPGGKSTLLRAALPDCWELYSNEPVRQRASILLENVAKWGYDRHHVTSLYARDYCASKMCFDLILCDVPCSGEGMFRKDEATIREWSQRQVEKCWQLQRDIVSEIWPCLCLGGLMIYSTCTFNTKENEENIRWMIDELDGVEVVPVEVKPEWHITGSLLDGFTEPVYRFIPGITRSEGLFVCVLRKKSITRPLSRRERRINSKNSVSTLSSPTSQPSSLSSVELTYQQSIAYLRRESLTLPADVPLGIIDVCFQGHVLGQVKNVGSRANNLYPKEWKIKTTHIPPEYSPIIK